MPGSTEDLLLKLQYGRAKRGRSCCPGQELKTLKCTDLGRVQSEPLQADKPLEGSKQDCGAQKEAL